MDFVFTDFDKAVLGLVLGFALLGVLTFASAAVSLIRTLLDLRRK